MTCMDARLNVERILELEEGDAHVIRNAGGLVTDDVLRSLEVSRSLGTEEAIVLLHTDCGARQGDLDAAVRDAVARIGWRARGMIYDVETGSLREVP